MDDFVPSFDQKVYNIYMQAAERFKDHLLSDISVCDTDLHLYLPGTHITVQSNSRRLLSLLSTYFLPFGVNQNTINNRDTTNITITAIETSPPITEPSTAHQLTWQDWSRDAGKQGRKDAYIDIENARLILKVRTGMVFLQCQQTPLAIGPCLKNSNQVINFINNQYMNNLQQNGWLICHAAAFSQQHKGIAIAGFSGSGKSTAMLHFLSEANTGLGNSQLSDTRYLEQSINSLKPCYVANHRLFIKMKGNKVIARGLPKWPRINPGTRLNNPDLKPSINSQKINHYQTLTSEQLWQIKEKSDVIIPHIYGQDRIQLETPLQHLLVLNWSLKDTNHHRTSSEESATQITQIYNLDARKDLLAALIKSKGPFFQYADGRFYQDNSEVDEEQYCDILKHIKVYEVSGKIDFDYLNRYCQQLLANS